MTMNPMCDVCSDPILGQDQVGALPRMLLACFSPLGKTATDHCLTNDSDKENNTRRRRRRRRINRRRKKPTIKKGKKDVEE